MFETPNAIQIRVSIDHIEPVIWRRLVMPIHWNLEQLHLVLQAAFNWWNYHLHEFRIGGLRFGDKAFLEEDLPADEPRVIEERGVRLRDFHDLPLSFTYLYDFGDGWHHTVALEQPLVLDPAPRQARCVDGARARPPEDVGGVGGYADFLAIMADPSDDEHADIKRWCGGHFDPEWFDLALVDKDVRNALKPNVRRRLHQPRPRRASRHRQ
jgi:hypothetical protein